MRKLLIGFLGIAVFAPVALFAQELVQDTVITMKARVVEVISERIAMVPGMDIEETLQTIRVEILDGPEKGAVVTIENDYLELKKGDVFYLNHTTSEYDGTDYYSPLEKVRSRSSPASSLSAFF
jgi:uncharacterized membrane protein